MINMLPIFRLKGFHYDAIAVSYSNEDMIGFLELTAFEGTDSSFMIHPNGWVILGSTANNQQDMYNFLAALEKYSDLSDAEIKKFKDDLKAGRAGDFVVNLGGTTYYLIYEQTYFMDWTIVGLVPSSVVNQNMSKLQKKEKQIYYRDELFEQLSTQVDDTPIIILTAYDWSDIEEEARNAGVTAFCSKPMFMSDLRDALDKVSTSKPGDYDLVLMDVQMPVMNGFISKPIELKELISVLKSVLGGIKQIKVPINEIEMHVCRVGSFESTFSFAKSDDYHDEIKERLDEFHEENSKLSIFQKKEKP